MCCFDSLFPLPGIDFREQNIFHLTCNEWIAVCTLSSHFADICFHFFILLHSSANATV